MFDSVDFQSACYQIRLMPEDVQNRNRVADLVDCYTRLCILYCFCLFLDYVMLCI